MRTKRKTKLPKLGLVRQAFKYGLLHPPEGVLGPLDLGKVSLQTKPAEMQMAQGTAKQDSLRFGPFLPPTPTCFASYPIFIYLFSNWGLLTVKLMHF